MPALNWIGKDKIINYANKIPYHVLNHKYNFQAKINSLFEDENNNINTGNKIIHGDNLIALKSLLPEYAGKIKCVYIDPPYNTGNENWVYNDNVSDPRLKKWLGEVVGKEGEDFTRHDKWLCMMYPRLKLLKDLLSDDGAIFISIDDNEQANLKLICDEIFGANNFVASIPWQSRQSLQNDTDLSINHEYIIVYAKKRRQQDRRLKASNKNYWYNIKEFAFYPLPIDNTKFSNPDNDPRGPWKADPFDAPNIRPNLTYTITNPNTGEKFLPPEGRHWRTEQDKFFKLMNDNRIIFGKTGKTKPQLKVFLSEQEQLGTVPNSWFAAEQYGTATSATKELQKIFENKSVFDTPKPASLIQKILQLATNPDSIILDSFAGSGTTAHAVLNLNKLDNGNRKFILIELEDYADNITAERVKRVMQGYNNIEGTGGSFDFYEVGEPIMINGELNKNLDIKDIYKYIWQAETGEIKDNFDLSANKYYLGEYDSTAIYFYYEPDNITCLNYEFLAQHIKHKSAGYIIYAYTCMLGDEFMSKNNIEFKKIPRDIKKFWSED